VENVDGDELGRAGSVPGLYVALVCALKDVQAEWAIRALEELEELPGIREQCRDCALCDTCTRRPAESENVRRPIESM